LGWAEARRLVVHPAYLVGALVVVPVMGLRALNSASLPSARQVFVFAVGAQLIWYGLVSLFAAGLVTSLARRSSAEDVLEASPSGAATRTAGCCLAVLLGPAAVSALLTVGAWLLERTQEEPFGLFTVAELAQVPFVVLGGGLLGVVAARWLPWRGGLLVAFMATVIATGWMLGRGRYGWLAPWSTARTLLDDADFAGGSTGLHTTYLALLCAVAAVLACLPDVRHRGRFAAIGAVIVAAAAVAGWAQLP
jgi:hypothetical protein